ncbi:MAG: glycosyltransferase [Verrucomicrobiales bacterium]|nr:glycosyltransferase [Verrucomicrobiales bacterium]
MNPGQSAIVTRQDPSSAGAGLPRHLLMYEPRVEGHHPAWLRFLTEDLLSGGYRLTLAVDRRERAREILEDNLGGRLSQVGLVSALDDAGRRRGGNSLRAVAICLEESGADQVFLPEFDEIASALLRRAAVGGRPAAALRGRIGGIYHRPRFLAAPRWSPNRWLKQRGFERLLTESWLKPLLFLDEYLLRELSVRHPGASLAFLPNPCPAGFPGERAGARRELGLPAGRHVFLFYGGGYRRKGLHLAVEAFRGLRAEEPAFLLCAGRQDPDARTARGLGELTRQGRARSLNRYVASAEEAACFVACDFVLLPYINHFGISAVLAQAAAARKPVIASAEQLLGRETQEYGLGLLFPSGDAAALRACVREAWSLPEARRAGLVNALESYARSHSRAAYRAAVLAALARP